MVKNKKAFLKIVESVIAAILIFLFIFAVTPKEQKVEAKVPEGVRLTQNTMLKEIQSNESLRGYLIEPNVNEISKFINSNMLPAYSFNVSVCTSAGTDCECTTANAEATSELCSQISGANFPSLPEDRSVYTKSVLIATPADKIVRLYIWQK